jgi:molybdate transport system substrate-binding protein
MATDSAHSIDLKVLCAGALSTIIGELAPAFERASGNTVSVTYDRSGTVRTHVLAGKIVDVVITTQEAVDDLVQQKMVAPDSVAIVGGSRIGVAVRAGASKPDISSVTLFKRALLNAKSIAYADPATGSPSGNHFVRVLQQLGIASEVAPKLKRIGAGRGSVVVVCEVVASGDAEIGIQQIAEILAVPDVELAGALPSELQKMTVFSAAVASGASDLNLARRFLQFITSETSSVVVKAKGMER